MFTIALYSFTKHQNSTKRPTGNGTAFSCQIISPSSIERPRVELQGADVSGYNYAYISEFGRYYWITDCSYNEGLWVLELRCDVLATYKTEIGAESLYILRSSAASNGNIVDNFYPTTSVSYGYADDDAFIPSGYGSGVYIVNIVGVATSGNSTLWKLQPSAFRSLISNLYSNIDGFQFTDIIEALRKLAGGSPEKLVSSAMWLPAYNFSSGASQRIIIGNWDSGVDGNLITDPLFDLSPITLSIPKHPQAASRGAFLNLAPYSTYTLNIPMFGAINIDTTSIKEASNIYINISVDAMSGQGRCRIHSGGSRPLIADLTAQIGVAVPLQGQSAGASIAGGIVSTLAGVAAAVASGGTATPIIGAAAAGLGTAVTALSGASFSTGSAGGALSVSHNLELNATFLHIASEDNSKNGRPLCQDVTPASLGGFMMAQRGDVPIAGTQAEQQEIKSYLEGGFYYE